MKQDGFKKKLAAYSAMATAFLASRPHYSEAQIMYTDVNPDLVIHNGFFNLDLNNDGVVDFKIDASAIGFSVSQRLQALNPLNKIAMEVPDTIYVTPFSNGDTISANDAFGHPKYLHFTYQTETLGGYYSSVFSVGYFWGTDKIAGLKIVSGGNSYYGWARLDVVDTVVVLKDYAVNTIPDSLIIAGEGSTSCTTNSLSISPIETQPLCGNDTIQLHVNAAGQSIQWLQNGNWVLGANSDSIIVSQPGNYSTLTVSGLCNEITTGPEIYNGYMYSIYTSIANPKCEEANGFIGIYYSGNISPFNYLWNTGATESYIDSLSPGEYSVTVSSNVCDLKDSLSFVLTNHYQPTQPIITLTDDFVLSTGSFENYQWYLNGEKIQYANKQYYSAHEVGYYQVEVTNSHECIAISDSVQVETIPGQPQHKPLYQFRVINKSIKFYSISGKYYFGTIRIVNELGETVAERKITTDIEEFDLSHFPPGIYYYFFVKETDNFTKELLKSGGKFLIAD